MQPKILEIVSQLGLTPNETKIYQELLERKTVGGAQLARELGLDKSSTYNALEKLVQLNLAVVTRKTRGTTYHLSDLDALKSLLTDKQLTINQQINSLDLLIEQIKKTSSKTERSTYIKVEKGFDSHKKLMELSLETKEKVIREKFPLSGPVFGGKKYDQYAIDFLRRRVKRKINALSLYNFAQSKFDKNFMKTDSKIRKEVRILPSELDNQNYLKIWDDYVEIISFNQDKTDFIVIVIKDKFVADLMKSLYNYIWDRSSTYYGNPVLPKIVEGSNTHSVIGIGTWGVGGYATKNPFTSEIEEVDQLRYALGQGITYVDTSHAYGAGHSLPLVSQAIANFPRESLFINSKIGYMVNSKSDVVKMCDHYLKTLNLEYVDRLMIHAPRAIAIPIEEVVSEIDKLIDSGKARSIGVSNFNVDQLKLAQAASSHKISAHEIHHNLMIRVNEENGVIDYCRAHNILLVAYQPLRRGFLVGLEDETLEKLANKYHKTQTQIILNWLSHQPGMMFLIKATRSIHINENIAALKWTMEQKDYKLLDNWRLPGYSTPEYDLTGNASTGIKIDKL